VTPESSGQGRFRILGCVEVHTGQGWREVSDAAWRSVLSVMLLHPGRVVPLSTLLGELWGNAPPPLAANLVAIYVARLRQMIGDTECRVLTPCPPGYLLQLQPGDLDAQCFEDLVAEARTAQAGRDPLRATVLLQQALGLWRGEALPGVRVTPLIDAAAKRLAELHLTAREMQAEADLACTLQVPSRPRLFQPPLEDMLIEGMLESAYSPSDRAKHHPAAPYARMQAMTAVADDPCMTCSDQSQTQSTGDSNTHTATPRLAPVAAPPPTPQPPDGDPMPDLPQNDDEKMGAPHVPPEGADAPEKLNDLFSPEKADRAKAPNRGHLQAPCLGSPNPRTESESADRPNDFAPGSATPDTPGFDLCPDPLAAQTAAELVEVLFQFRIWAGEPSFREMERRCAHQVAASTMCVALTCDKLPKLPVIQAILAACGASQEQHQAFATAWRRIRMS